MGKLLCEKNLRVVWCRNESVRAEIGPILRTHTHTHTHTRVSYSSIDKDDIFLNVTLSVTLLAGIPGVTGTAGASISTGNPLDSC